MSFAQHISAVSKSLFNNIRDLRRSRNTIDQSTACPSLSFILAKYGIAYGR